MIKKKKIKVLIIDDSSLVRDILARGLSQDPIIEVVGTAPDAYIARDKILSLKPDVLTLDIEMPKMDGLEFLRKLMPQYPLPVIVVSSLSQAGKHITLKALELGAVDFIPKPSSDMINSLPLMLMELRTKIRIASSANVSHWKKKFQNSVFSENEINSLKSNIENKKNSTIETHFKRESTDKVIAIGASTGGTEAIRKIISQLPVNIHGIVIVQHMPAGFTRLFAENLNKFSNLNIKEAENNERIIPGKVLIAPGGFHIRVVRDGGMYKVVCSSSENVNGHCPSIDVFMRSVAENVGKNSYGILLTGMGKDGAEGLKAMKQKGSINIAQDESTSVVFGMPKVAYEIGATDVVLPIDKIANYLIELINKNN
ncbi:MAG: chemotaxis response regulator protein-glutamate methylesterase [Cyanobacteriota bacterium]